MRRILYDQDVGLSRWVHTHCFTQCIIDTLRPPLRILRSFVPDRVTTRVATLCPPPPHARRSLCWAPIFISRPLARAAHAPQPVSHVYELDADIMLDYSRPPLSSFGLGLVRVPPLGRRIPRLPPLISSLHSSSALDCAMLCRHLFRSHTERFSIGASCAALPAGRVPFRVCLTCHLTFVFPWNTCRASPVTYAVVDFECL